MVRKRSRGAATATCPKGEHVSFGGVVAQFSPPPGSGPSVFPTGMRRTADNHWTVYGESGTDVIGSRLTAVAYCDRGAVPRVASNTVSMPGFRSASAIATCPAGTSLVGGGYNSGASSTHVEAVARLDALSSTKWLVTMINLMPTATTVTAIAYCASGKPLTVVSTLLKVAGRRGGTARVSCPGGTSLVFGGLLASSAQSGSHLSAVLPFSWTAETTKQWVVTGYNVGDLPAYLTAIGYCR